MTRVLIVDDEQSARTRLRQLVECYADLELVGECETADGARVEMERLAPEIVFLDIQMPGASPIEMLRETPGTTKRAVIFVTAHSTYGVDAFDVGAADYLLKPFTASRFAKALHRARERLGTASTERISVRQTDGRVVAMAPSDIVWIESHGNNLTVHARSATLTVRSTMASFLERLAPLGFTRIHRSYAVNAALVRELQPWSHGEYVVVMDDGTRLNSSRTFRTNVNALIGPT